MTEKNDTSRFNEKYIFRNIRQEEIPDTGSRDREDLFFRQMVSMFL